MMKNGKLLVAPALLWLSIFFVIPLLIVVAVSFAGRTPYGQVIFSFTFANYLRFLEPLYLKIFADTLGVAIVTTIATILMGYPLAYTIAQLPKKWQQPGLILVMIPFWINFLIRSYAWVIILRSQGVVNTLLLKLGLIDQPLQMLYNDMAVMLGMVYALLPFMVLPIYVSIEQLDTRLLEAASDLGAKPLTAFRKITLPLTMPGIAAGTILVFISSLGMFVVPDVMGGAKSALIGNLIQNQFLSARDWPFGSALSIVLALLSLVLIILYYRALQSQEGGDKDAKNVA
ncbi:ABC transporter permease [Phascolarctobacterium sp.]|uniref:ABC transporter permease n=2 Tax=Phascolarctobacterium TaxID=33024 RepID=UPI0025EDB1C1|nr:ABC transporter permease [uncultured Phascolarctobacterium sp.]